jgi:hypothetical protein
MTDRIVPVRPTSLRIKIGNSALHVAPIQNRLSRLFKRTSILRNRTECTFMMPKIVRTLAILNSSSLKVFNVECVSCECVSLCVCACGAFAVLFCRIPHKGIIAFLSVGRRAGSVCKHPKVARFVRVFMTTGPPVDRLTTKTFLQLHNAQRNAANIFQHLQTL